MAQDNQNVWFGVSMGLAGIIVGFIAATFLNGSGFSFGGTQAPDVPAGVEEIPVEEQMANIVDDLGFSTSDFNTCVESKKYEAKVNEEMAGGSAAGVNGTPGNILLDMKTGKARLISGAQPFANFQKNIDEMLANPNAASADPNTPLATNVVPVNLETEHILGDKNAQLALIEYSDFECPFCTRVYPTLKQILAQYDGKVMLVYRHFPLPFHPKAMPYALGSECIAEQGGNEAFWKFADALFGA